MSYLEQKFDWSCNNTWKRSAKNTAWCLLGCAIGDFGTILYFQITGIPWPVLAIMTLAIINGLITSIILDQELKQYDIPYNVHHEPNSIAVANFLNKGIFIDVQVVDSECAVHRLRHDELGEIRGKLSNNFPSGAKVKLLLQPEDLIHDDQSKLKLEVVDRKFRGTNFIYTLKTKNDEHLPVFVHSHHIHQHEKSEKFGIKSPIYIDHLVCF